MWSVAFWKAAVERAIRTVAQTMLSLWVVGDVVFNVFTVNWNNALGVGAGAALISLVMSLTIAGVSDNNSPSITTAEVLAPEPHDPHTH